MPRGRHRWTVVMALRLLLAVAALLQTLADSAPLAPTTMVWFNEGVMCFVMSCVVMYETSTIHAQVAFGKGNMRMSW